MNINKYLNPDVEHLIPAKRTNIQAVDNREGKTTYNRTKRTGKVDDCCLFSLQARSFQRCNKVIILLYNIKCDIENAFSLTSAVC